MIEVKRKEGESASSLLYRFSRRVQQSGVIIDVRRRRFYKRKTSSAKQKVSALHRIIKQREYERKKKFGLA
jgi:ribosomal protein S21